MGIFGKRTKTVKEEVNVEKTEKKEVTGTYTRSELVGLQRETIKDLLKEAVSDVTDLLVEQGIDEDMARVYLVLKKYQKPVAKLIDLGYEELYLEIKKTEELEEAIKALSEQSAKQNEIIENQNKILDRMAKAIENSNKIENLCTKKEK